ncbi:fatty acid desaturase [Pseudenhygromyxa sp. WMMC2535]|uniref:fatty acid desaturase family protein n=1 Tax=Pseudenhygromyxa sp. WMMC2535 TaxID=2712867 RepID=UPI00155450CD|nr:fatty acid desaturase [Pseudenhygromyxa sp. WMMC2535]NVB41264.1 fatty acid desaturase [Pseudenhygromyxa sp. WMMC2535]
MADPGPPTIPAQPAPWDALALRLINDPRDLTFVHLMAACATTALLGLSLYPISKLWLTGPWFWAAGVVYLAIWGLWTVDRFILMLHCTSHRILFRREVGWLNQVIPWVLGPFFGETPQTYFCHHMGMHHPENNLHDDLSSTMPYQRDRLSHWLRYYLRFMTLVLIELPLYFLRRGQRKMAARTLLGEGSYWLVVGLLAYVDWRATLVVFVIPVLMVRTLMMAGNWAQHAFVDASDPNCAYRNSITCIDSRYNRRCFNDGYHIHHHVKARCHWSEYPGEFAANQALYGEKDAIIFRGLDFFIVWALLMTGRYRTLAKAMVELPGAPERTIDERIAFMRSRLRPIPRAS